MADTRKLTMVFTLDNGDDFKYNLADPKDELTKSEGFCCKVLNLLSNKVE